MPLENNLYKMNIELQTKVSDEIDKATKGLSKKSISQLQIILKELYSMERSKGLIISYPRIIIDSWDHSDSLGMELVDFAGLYKKLSKH